MQFLDSAQGTDGRLTPPSRRFGNITGCWSTGAGPCWAQMPNT